MAKSKRFICIIITCLLFVFEAVCCFAQTTNELIKNVSFSFSVNMSSQFNKYKITVTNNTDTDIVKFCVCDKQYNGNTVKEGTLDFRSYPLGTTTDCLVPAGETEVFEPSKIMWQDCNKVINYVYYIEFSDGTKWGNEYSDFATIETYALKYETPFEYEKITTAQNAVQQKVQRKEKNNAIIIAVFFIGVPIVTSILSSVFSKKRKTTHYAYSRRATRIRRNYRIRPYKKTYYNSKNANYQFNNTTSNYDAEKARKMVNQYIDEINNEEYSKKGKTGEFFVYEKLETIPGEKRLLHNIYIPISNGKTTEIDCLMIHQKGLFVIESKNYSGHIYGSPNDKQWTQVIGKNKHYSFYNPINQNEGHIKNLLMYLSYSSQDKYRNIPVYSVISFGPNTDISNVKLYGLQYKNTFIVNTEHLDVTITNIINSISLDFCSTQDIDQIYQYIYPNANVTEAEKKRHIENIKNQF